MNARTIVLIGAVALLGVGVLLTIADALKPAPAANRVETAVAAQQIEPYTVVTQDMIRTGPAVLEREAEDGAIWPWSSVVGKMTTRQLAPGDTFSASNLKPIEEVRFVEDLGLEVLSFSASMDKLLGGQLRPGHIINLYGYSSGSEEDSYTTLIEPRLWVVGVTSGGQAVSRATAVMDTEDGVVTYENTDMDRPGTLVTVAVPPAKAFHIIQALGQDRLTAWVSLAANQTVASALATPAATIVAPTPGLDFNLAQTATALALKLQATQPPPVPKTGGGGAR